MKVKLKRMAFTRREDSSDLEGRGEVRIQGERTGERIGVNQTTWSESNLHTPWLEDVTGAHAPCSDGPVQ